MNLQYFSLFTIHLWTLRNSPFFHFLFITLCISGFFLDHIILFICENFFLCHIVGRFLEVGLSLVWKEKIWRRGETSWKPSQCMQQHFIGYRTQEADISGVPPLGSRHIAHLRLIGSIPLAYCHDRGQPLVK